MRDTIDFGIDLGTTNSAIAVVDNGEVKVIRSNRRIDYIPSAVMISGKGEVRVGDSALPYVYSDPANAAAEFKLKMGMANAGRAFANSGRRLTPTELSAEVLKTLRSFAARDYGQPPESAVITVPAAFALNQTNATNEAAKLAGFTVNCPLVQEPTAAAFAYGFADQSERAYWMVFDLGGGTFDAAIVTKRDGEMQVLNHAGDPYLGGKLIDWAIVERLVAPTVAAEYRLADFTRDNPRWETEFLRMKQAAEEAKIQLSQTHHTDVLVDFGRRSELEAFEYALTREQLEQIATPFYLQAINHCRNALAEGNLSPATIDRLLLVGSPTLAPGLRELLADPRDGLGIPLDHSQDPSTVVARGAALYASTVRLERPMAAPKAGEFAVELSYEPSVDTLQPTVGGRVSTASTVDWTTYSVSLRAPGRPHDFDSGRLPLRADGTFLTEVQVQPDTTTRVSIQLVDGTGRPQLLRPDSFSITHGGPMFGGPVLAQTLGIGRADDTFARMLEKNKPLPAETTQPFETTVALRRDMVDSVVRIPVFEGENNRAERNREIGMLEIKPTDVRIDLPVGTPIDVTLKVDTSRLVAVLAEIPSLGTFFEATLNLDQVEPPSPDELLRMLADTERRLTELHAQAERSGSPEALTPLAKLDEQNMLENTREQVRAARVDRAAAATADERIREIEAILDEVEQLIKLPALFKDLQDALSDCADEVRRDGRGEDQRELDNIKKRAGEAIANRDGTAATALLERTTELYFDVRRRSPTWDAEIFYALRRMRDQMSPSAQADTLLWEGEQAIAAGNYRVLPGINQRLRRLLPPGVTEPTPGSGRSGVGQQRSGGR
ncbi:Hsp70 family protein [Fodinicola acaciae]|uniref:Hsp70 family protein n=1 Tax=Fodinicola acaciae TaxID=2681555 RepID=UPI0013D8D38F|nr:Hsp70 family protein [Fodinicola acaciae]